MAIVIIFRKVIAVVPKEVKLSVAVIKIQATVKFRVDIITPVGV
jgi:hypothetical protein